MSLQMYSSIKLLCKKRFSSQDFFPLFFSFDDVNQFTKNPFDELSPLLPLLIPNIVAHLPKSNTYSILWTSK